jgi:hypothetical protein
VWALVQQRRLHCLHLVDILFTRNSLGGQAVLDLGVCEVCSAKRVAKSVCA